MSGESIILTLAILRKIASRVTCHLRFLGLGIKFVSHQRKLASLIDGTIRTSID